jgi:bifunctional DNA-binding transcriptional regulator/antitoxin component of YhaV-PrlF toxin-antitoxin module
VATKVKDRRENPPLRVRRNGYTKVSAKNQVTLPVAALAAAGVRAGDKLQVSAGGPGRIVLTIDEDVVDKYAGCLTGVYGPGYLEKLRSEWDRPWDSK